VCTGKCGEQVETELVPAVVIDVIIITEPVVDILTQK
jgi:hypothetical protein